MQLEGKHIYKLVHQKNDIPEDLVKSIGDCIFKNLNKLQSNPPNLIINIEGLGRRYLRRAKIEDRLRLMELFRKQDEQTKHPDHIAVMRADEITMKRISAIYKLYIEKRERIKTIRNEFTASNKPSIPTQTL